MTGIRHPFRHPPGDGPAVGTIRSVWLAAGRGGGVQHRLPGLDGRIILLGRGEVAGVGPGARPGAAVRLEFLLPIRFRTPFAEVPHVVLLPEADGEPGIVGLRDIGPEGFTLVLRPPPGSPRCDRGYHWVAIGRSAPPAQVPLVLVGKDPAAVPPGPRGRSSGLPGWLRGIAACAALLPVPALRLLRPGARIRAFGGVPGGAKRVAGWR